MYRWDTGPGDCAVLQGTVKSKDPARYRALCLTNYLNYTGWRETSMPSIFWGEVIDAE